MVRVAVVGAHLSGMPLNFQLTQRGARRVAASHTSRAYRLYALPGTVPPKPGLARVANDTAGAGTAIAMELWDMPLDRFGEFVAEVPAPLGIGNVELESGEWVKGFICEPCGIEGAQDISRFGGWKNYLASRVVA
jgi:allophanate hydrolase